MKSKCCINGCGRRGIWQGRSVYFYCDVHYHVALEESGRQGHFPFTPDKRYLGRVHEGQKRGKPYVWEEFFRA